MRRVRLTALSVGLLVGLLLNRPVAAMAALIGVDLSAPGDQLLTLDTATGLEWLDLTQTQGLSYDAVAGGTGGWIAGGFKIANATQVGTLFTDAGATNLTGAFLSSQFTAAQDLMNLLGCTSTGGCGGTAPFTIGLADLDPASSTFAAEPEIQISPSPSLGAFDTPNCLFCPLKTAANPTTGVWLERDAPVPEPSTLLLLAFGLGGLAVWRRRFHWF